MKTKQWGVFNLKNFTDLESEDNWCEFWTDRCLFVSGVVKIRKLKASFLKNGSFFNSNSHGSVLK